MNRKERRLQERQIAREQKQNIVTVNKQELKEEMEKYAKKEAEKVFESKQKEMMTQAVQDLTSAFIIVLSDRFGFGKKRLNQVLEYVNSQYECINAGEVTIDDMREICKGLGIDFESVYGKP